MIIPIIITIASARFLEKQVNCFGPMFDAGSSGTRVYIYTWPCRTTNTYPLIDLQSITTPELKITPGLSTFYNNLEGIQEYMQPLLEFAYSNIPANMYQYSPIILGATAGLRLLDLKLEQSIIKEVQLLFSQTQFLYNQDWISVITGQQEGVFLWMSLYYMLQEQQDLISIDLGGASTQIAIPETNNTQNQVIVNMIAENIDLYAVSYLGYGNDQARAVITSYSIENNSQVIQSPCYHLGYIQQWEVNQTYTIIGTAQLQQCQELINRYLNISNSSSINGHYQPTITNQTIYGVSGIASMAQLYNLSQFTLPQFYEMTAAYCSISYSEIQAKSEYTGTSYFMSVYAYQLLSLGYGIPNTSIINAPIQLQGTTPTWTLAAMAYPLSQSDCQLDSPICQSFSTIRNAIILILICFLQ